MAIFIVPTFSDDALLYTSGIASASTDYSLCLSVTTAADMASYIVPTFVES